MEPWVPKKPITVKELIEKLQKMNPDAKALFSFNISVGEETHIGFTAHDSLRSIKVIEDKPGYYTESNSPEATEVIVFE